MRLDYLLSRAKVQVLEALCFEALRFNEASFTKQLFSHQGMLNNTYIRNCALGHIVETEGILSQFLEKIEGKRWKDRIGLVAQVVRALH